ncbi:hypothetical protein XCY_001834 [Xanthomonas arboricola pv. juglandis]|uniref:hypothetical protein n=1 Tax=Xanthomonas arboricola TaxID=56448 RepID=UPI001AF13E59|nr:hypothetical protein [Xanthomonas arboricola]CAG2089089.1 hypothetical protein XCY_001834 [Xanthomonas arboricola pv. juglandis]
MNAYEAGTTRNIRGFTVKATTELCVDPPGRFDAKLVVIGADGEESDKLVFRNIHDPFQSEADALEAARDFLQNIDLTEEGRLISPW